MAKFDDAQIDKTVVTTAGSTSQLHSPAGQIPAHGADAPYVHPRQAGSGITGGPVVAIATTAVGVRIANPA